MKIAEKYRAYIKRDQKNKKKALIVASCSGAIIICGLIAGATLINKKQEQGYQNKLTAVFNSEKVTQTDKTKKLNAEIAYADQMQGVNLQITQTLTTLKILLDDKTVQTITSYDWYTQYNEIQKAITGLQTSLSSIKPPEEYKLYHKTLTTQVKKLTSSGLAINESSLNPNKQVQISNKTRVTFNSVVKNINEVNKTTKNLETKTTSAINQQLRGQ